MSGSFRSDYQELELPETADWAAARAGYRRLVNRWHPDRYAQRPRERAHAQARFIRLNLSFDRLRHFYREHERLPFQSVHVEHPDVLVTRRRQAAEHEAREREPAAPDPDVIDSAGLFGAARPRIRTSVHRGRIAFAVLAIVLLMGTLVMVRLIDRSLRYQALEAGRDVLRASEPSEFMQSATEVRHQQTRGAFIERPDSGKLGDQLMEDVFR